MDISYQIQLGFYLIMSKSTNHTINKKPRYLAVVDVLKYL